MSTRRIVRSLRILLAGVPPAGLALVGPALVGLALVWAAPGASAADPVSVKATSPGYTRVGVVPDSVSVTFTGSIKDDGTSVTVTGPGGGRFGVRSEVVGDTLREFLAPGPAGPYAVEWAATGKGGEKLSGSFSFVAGQAHAGYTTSSASVAPSPSPSSSPSLSPSASPSASPSPRPSPSPSPGRPGPSAGDSFAVPRIVLPIGVAALLVAVSVLVAALNRRRRTNST